MQADAIATPDSIPEGERANNMTHIVKLLAPIALACSLATAARAESSAKRVDIGGDE